MICNCVALVILYHYMLFLKTFRSFISNFEFIIIYLLLMCDVQWWWKYICRDCYLRLYPSFQQHCLRFSKISLVYEGIKLILFELQLFRFSENFKSLSLSRDSLNKYIKQAMQSLLVKRKKEFFVVFCLRVLLGFWVKDSIETFLVITQLTKFIWIVALIRFRDRNCYSCTYCR